MDMEVTNAVDVQRHKLSRQTGFIHPLKSGKYERSAIPSVGMDLIAIQDKIKKNYFEQ